MTIDVLVYFAVYAFMVIVSKLTVHSTITLQTYIFNSLLTLIILFLSRIVFGTYRNIWRYASYSQYLKMILADFIGGLAALGTTHALRSYDIINGYIGVWQSVSVVVVALIGQIFARLLYQYYRMVQIVPKNASKEPIAIVGAGRVGSMLARELLYSKSSVYYPFCFIDVNARKIGSTIFDVTVWDGMDENLHSRIRAARIKTVVIAMTEPDGDRAKTLYENYKHAGFNVLIYAFQFVNGKIDTSKRQLREFKIEDLLFRNSIKATDRQLMTYYTGKTVMVTGGGGSIGSEICRQIAMLDPKRLIILDIYENNAYEIQQELIRKYGDLLDLRVEIASVRDRDRLDRIFAYYRPDVVFHAAAHKHVPLMEHNGVEAIKNNVLGTYNTADMAEKYGAKKFILISTDKAVNPTNVMGASKRMCEMIVQCRNDSNTSFAAVRFGNVLGSNGSVIPLFRQQIESGGPVTITDKRIIRYFMTIPEASQLVMLAGAAAKRGQLFVLDMGKPVKIIDLAENMIRLMGLEPGRDIEIEEIGLRPGEKLYEELLIKTEELDKTDNDLIFVERDTPLSRAEVDAKIEILKATIATGNSVNCIGIKEAFKAVVPTFKDPDLVNRNAAQAEEMKMVNA
ncbi:MAG: polysaccharide biosynthesis protein [Clostridia bacterium]|nr:polysaccharide biosynthesis protein [Clostridia bacterium]